MSNKQIDEMANDYYEAMLKASVTLGSMNEGAPKWYAKELYNAGYRKVTRCKDCKYKVETDEAGYDPHDIVCAYHASDGFDETDFCSAAVRGRYGEGRR